MIRFSIKNVFRKKIIVVLSSLGIGFGLMLMFVLGAFSLGVVSQIQDNFAEVLGVVEIQEKNPLSGRSELPSSILDTLLSSPLGDEIQNYNVKVSLPTDNSNRVK
jgi:ABC-type lipoprotein release transport system permease subunit